MPPFEFAPPIPVADGIRAKTQRGQIGRTWWSWRFRQALETYYGTTASRLARGRAYARAGQVVRMAIEAGRVQATVQGSRPVPYEVTIRVKVLGDRDWARIERAMVARAVFLARLLSGEMPDEIEAAFEAADVRLFPERRGDLQTVCTCPDSANPCKHVAAVYYLLAESFDEDPFLIFAMRGRPRQQLLADLRALRQASSPRPRAAKRSATRRCGGDANPAATARDALGRFWHGSPGWAEVAIDPHPSGPSDAVLRVIDPEIEAALGSAGMAWFRAVYREAARTARARLDPGFPTPGAATSRPRRRRPRDGERQD